MLLSRCLKEGMRDETMGTREMALYACMGALRISTFT
jgi:hypothetical protein